MIDHLSYSSIYKYLQCGKSWKFHYVDKVETDTKDALILGSIWHKFLRLVGDEGRPPIISLLESLVNESEDPVQFETRDKLESMRSSTDIQEYLSNIKGMTYGDWETRIEFSVPGVPVPVIGFIDLIEPDGTMVDFKTSGRKWNQSKADFNIQPTFYVAGALAAGLITLEDFPIKFQFHIFTKTKVPTVQILTTYRTMGQVLGLYDLISEVWSSIQSNSFIPNPLSWVCSPSYCQFWNICEGGSLFRGVEG